MAGKKKMMGSDAGDLASAVKAAMQAVKAAKDAVASLGLAKLTADERLHLGGRLRDGEERALLTVLDAMDAHPVTFLALADRDGGVDPSAVETGPARAALARRATLAPLAAELEALSTAVNDDLLASVAAAKALTVPAYAIAKANAPVDAKLRKSVSGAIDFYAKSARRKSKA